LIVTSFLAQQCFAADYRSMTPDQIKETPFLQRSAALLELVEELNLIEQTPGQILLPTEDRVMVAAEVMLYCEKFKTYTLSRKAVGARATLRRVRRLYNF
jgi:hypothetical protein